MADKNIEMKRKNADGTYDNYYPVTKATNVKMQDGTDVETKITAHLADNVPHVPYVVAAGVANAYAVTLNPAPTSYTEGMAIAVKINVNNTGASTINVTNLGAKSIKKPNRI